MGGNSCVPESTPLFDFLLFLASVFFDAIVVKRVKESLTKATL